MSFTGKILSFAALSSLAASAAFAQSVPPSVAACTSEKDSLARLVCFDREVAKYTQSSARVAPTPTPPAAVSPPAATVVATPPPAATPKDDEFGVSGKLAKERAAAKGEVPAEQKELRASVTKVTIKPFGELVLELDNGQVWEQPEKKASFIINAGDGIVIRQARFGSFMLTADSGATTRIRRIH
jgi:hypothetical protein